MALVDAVVVVRDRRARARGAAHALVLRLRDVSRDPRREPRRIEAQQVVTAGAFERFDLPVDALVAVGWGALDRDRLHDRARAAAAGERRDQEDEGELPHGEALSSFASPWAHRMRFL